MDTCRVNSPVIFLGIGPWWRWLDASAEILAPDTETETLTFEPHPCSNSGVQLKLELEPSRSLVQSLLGYTLSEGSHSQYNMSAWWWSET